MDEQAGGLDLRAGAPTDRQVPSLPSPRTGGLPGPLKARTTGAAPPRRRAQRSGLIGVPLRGLSLIALVVLLAATVGATFATRALLRDQEKRLLKERAGEVGLILTQAINALQTPLSALGAVATLSNSSPTAFAEVAEPQIKASPGTRALLVARPTKDGAYAVQVAAGQGFSTGSTITGIRARTFDQALQGQGKLAATPVITEGSHRYIGLAMGPPAAPDGAVMYDEIQLGPAASSTATTSSAPFAELDIALYASTRQDPRQIVLTTTKDLPLTGQVSTSTQPVGTSSWLLTAKARQPLVGSFAAGAPWWVLGTGLAGTILVVLILEMTFRRRDFALDLVDERTQELRESLEELESTQSQLVQKERLAAVGQLAAAVGHELRNPLGVITNALYLIRGAIPAENGAAERHLGIAEREVGAATLIVSDLLEFAKNRQPITTDVDIVGLIDESLEVASPPSNISVEWEPGPGRPLIRADRDQLRQVLVNLLVNACDAMPGGGTLSIRLRDDLDTLQIGVTDTGTGMDEATRERIFQPFYTTKARGVGLGLAVSERVVRMHGGQLAVDSAAGLGSTFTISLPHDDHDDHSGGAGGTA